MSCTHCDQIREVQEAYVAEHGPMRQATLGESKAQIPDHCPPWDSYPKFTPKQMADCRCDCHALQRLVGYLPRLKEVAA